MSAPPAPGRRGPIARWLPLVFLVGLPLVALASGASHLLSLDSLLASRAWLKAFVAADYVRAMAAAYLVYLGAVVVSVPATLILTMICGFLFGIVPGALLAVCAATTGGSLVFSIGRGPGRELLQRFGGPRLERFAAAFRRDAFLGLLPGAFVYATTGAGIDEVVAAHEAARATCLAGGGLACDDALTPAALVTPKMVLGLSLLGAFGLFGLVLARRLRARGEARPGRGGDG